MPSRRLYAACSEFDEAELFKASATVFFQNVFRRHLRRTFYQHMAEQDCPAVYFKLPSAACAGMPYFLRRNYNRRKAKAALLLLTPRSTLKRRSYAETTFQNDFFIDKPHITQLPRLKANGRMPPPYAAIPPCFFRIARRLFSRQHARLYAISAKLCRNLYFCGRIYINNLTNFPFVI